METRRLISGLLLTVVSGSGAFADVVGTGHDFTGFGWSDSQICKPCHTPHDAISGINDAPLWNHEVTTASYKTHDRGDGVPADQALDGRSILCMSCHDGTVALDVFGGDSGMQPIGGAGLLGTDLTDDHPVGADAVYADGPWLVPASIWENTVGFGFALRDMEVNGTMERVVSCTTCHEPHNRNRNEHLLWKDNDRSGLCLTCHTTGRLSPRPVPRESGRPPLP